jgi:hypothetical protein
MGRSLSGESIVPADHAPQRLSDDSQDLIAFADSDPSSRTPGFVDVVERNQFPGCR